MTATGLKLLALITCVSAFPLMVGLTGCAGDRQHQGTGHPVGPNLATERGRNESSTDQRMEDSRTAQRVREALAANVDYRYGGVKVMASNGVVRLSGYVRTNSQRSSAGEVAGKVAGVKEVVNNLTIQE
jgi:osmotically-inducible protein OsmY